MTFITINGDTAFIACLGMWLATAVVLIIRIEMYLKLEKKKDKYKKENDELREYIRTKLEGRKRINGKRKTKD